LTLPSLKFGKPKKTQESNLTAIVKEARFIEIARNSDSDASKKDGAFDVNQYDEGDDDEYVSLFFYF
jgi:hypothetical protein